MKQILILFWIISSISCKAQNIEDKTFPGLEKILIDFMITNGDIAKIHIQQYREGKFHLNIIGLQNMITKGDLRDGVYSFSQSFSHSKIHSVIVESSKVQVLNLSTRADLDVSLKNLMDFCERQKYCEAITEDYVKRMLRVYYTINKYPATHVDYNCTNGVSDTKGLP